MLCVCLYVWEDLVGPGEGPSDVGIPCSDRFGCIVRDGPAGRVPGRVVSGVPSNMAPGDACCCGAKVNSSIGGARAEAQGPIYLPDLR